MRRNLYLQCIYFLKNVFLLKVCTDLDVDLNDIEFVTARCYKKMQQNKSNKRWLEMLNAIKEELNATNEFDD